MPPARDLEKFEAEFLSAVRVVLPATRVYVVQRTLVAIKLRVEISKLRFIDVFYNADNGRTDLSVVEGDQRIFGYDNLGGWHKHPANQPERHDPCEEPKLEDFLREAAALRP
jgi:hypothetical protein